MYSFHFCLGLPTLLNAGVTGVRFTSQNVICFKGSFLLLLIMCPSSCIFQLSINSVTGLILSFPTLLFLPLGFDSSLFASWYTFLFVQLLSICVGGIFIIFLRPFIWNVFSFCPILSVNLSVSSPYTSLETITALKTPIFHLR